MSKDTFQVVTHYPVTEYRCGVRAGDQVRLKHDIVVKNARGKHSGKMYPKGQLWTVLLGAAEEPIVVWLQRADGQTHTWDDGSVFLKTFEIIPGATA